METIQLKGQATPDQIKIWKDKYSEIFAIKCEDKVAYLKKPDRKVLGYASAEGQKDPLKFNEILLKNCWIGGSEELRDDDAYFLSVSGKLAELIEIKAVELEKL